MEGQGARGPGNAEEGGGPGERGEEVQEGWRPTG